MLLQFSVANHLSIRDRQTLSLVASSLSDAADGLLEYGGVPNGRVLPAAVIYGANASGKTNVFDAVAFMRHSVLNSHRLGDPEGGVQRMPFLLDPVCGDEASSYEIDFVSEGVRYHYGFECDDAAFTAEWLYAFPRGRRQVLFERDGQKFVFGRGLKGRKEIIADITRPNSLFVSAATQNGHEELSRISRYFSSMDSVGMSPWMPLQWPSDGIDRRVIEVLRQLGAGITDYRIQKVELLDEDQKSFLQTIKSDLVKMAERHSVSLPAIFDNEMLELGHQALDGKTVYLNIVSESAGTQRLLILLTHAFRALDKGQVLFIDELDASLHTQACEEVLELFCSPETNPAGAQIVATTHDTNLLNSRLLRRDQVWFAEKDENGATGLYPLTDIRTRKGDNLEKGYLEGRFGATPTAVVWPDVFSRG